MQEQQVFDIWGIVELFGHAKIAGRLTEQNVAGSNMLRVDVPETDKQPAFSRLLGSGAIYAINPTDQATATTVANNLNVTPLTAWDISEVVKANADKVRAMLPENLKSENQLYSDFSPELDEEYDDPEFHG